MSPQTIVFMGRAGSGKGTQARLISEYLKKNDKTEQPVLYIETGARIRRFIQEEGYTNKLALGVADTGGLEPDFFAIWNWSDPMIRELTEDTHLLIDGAPRSLLEAEVLDTALDFYQRKNTVVIYITVRDEWSRELLKKRGRTDDSQAVFIDHRMELFDSKIIPAINMYKASNKHAFMEVDGEQPIEKVHEDIIKALKWQ